MPTYWAPWPGNRKAARAMRASLVSGGQSVRAPLAPGTPGERGRGEGASVRALGPLTPNPSPRRGEGRKTGALLLAALGVRQRLQLLHDQLVEPGPGVSGGQPQRVLDRPVART